MAYSELSLAAVLSFTTSSAMHDYLLGAFMNKLFAVIILAILSSSTFAQFADDNLGYGFIEGIKIGNFNEDQISVLLEDGYTHDMRECFGTVFIHADDMSELRFESIRAIVFSAHQNHYKIRFHSHLDESLGCRTTFVMVGEEYW